MAKRPMQHRQRPTSVSYTHLRAHETRHDLVCRLLLEKKKKKTKRNNIFFFLMIRRPPRSTQSRSSAASDVYKRQPVDCGWQSDRCNIGNGLHLSLIHISEPTRLGMISYAVFCLKKKKKRQKEITFFFF